MSSGSGGGGGGIGLLGGTFLVFLAAKLFGAITWSWWWVFSPLWIIPAILVAGFVLTVLFAYAVRIGIALADRARR